MWFCMHVACWPMQVLEVQPPTKKAMAAKDFRNGVRKKKLLLPSATLAAKE